MQQLSVPHPHDGVAWTAPATADEAREIAAYLITALDPDLMDNPRRVGFLSGLIAGRRYSRAELLFAAQRVPFLNDYGKGFSPHLIEDTVQAAREVRRRLAQKLTRRERDEVMRDAARLEMGTLKEEDFHLCGYEDGWEGTRPLYRYAPGVRRSREAIAAIEALNQERNGHESD